MTSSSSSSSGMVHVEINDFWLTVVQNSVCEELKYEVRKW